MEATLFFKDTLMLILYKNVRNVRFVLFTKTSNIEALIHLKRKLIYGFVVVLCQLNQPTECKIIRSI